MFWHVHEVGEYLFLVNVNAFEVSVYSLKSIRSKCHNVMEQFYNMVNTSNQKISAAGEISKARLIGLQSLTGIKIKR
mgnify:CR=1 FL=1